MSNRQLSNNNSNLHNNGINNITYENPAYVSYFYGRLLREESEKILKQRGCQNGLFLLRELVQESGSYALSICYNNEVHHYKIDRQNDGTVKIDKGRSFIGPIELIKHHQIDQDGLIIKPTTSCDRPKGTSPIYYLFVNDSEFNKLVDDEINIQINKRRSQLSSQQYIQELNDARGRFRYRYEKIVLKELHNTQPWFKNNCDRMKANQLLSSSGLKNGKFIVRSSSDNLSLSSSSTAGTSSTNDSYKISLCFNKEIKHYKIKYSEYLPGMGRFSLDGGLEFESLIQLVDYYHRCADGLADILRMPLLPVPNSIDSVWFNTNDVNNMRISTFFNERTEGIYDSNRMYQAIMNGYDRNSHMLHQEYFDDEPNNSNDINDLTRVPETKRNIFQDGDNYEYESFSTCTVDSRDLQTYDQLGAGCFGSVYRGTYKLKDKKGRVEQEIPVAIKQLNLETEESKTEIIKEAETMKSLKNTHIIKFIGMCFDQKSERFMIVLELAKLGPLHKYLRANKEHMSMLKIVKICYQVAFAMEYIASKNLVHRDLAARNVLLASEEHAKVSDFGMSRKMDENLYYTTQTTGKWPLKWYPPEASTSGKFDEKSDVWSFGVTCWEATSYGARPYQGLDISLLILKLENGHRLEKPQQCPTELFNIMYKCWYGNKHKRPTFSEIVRELKNVINELYKIDI